MGRTPAGATAPPSGGLIRRPRDVTTVERFVRAITAGGLALVAGLWIATYLPRWSLPWVLGAGLVLVGVGALAGGIRLELDP